MHLLVEPNIMGVKSNESRIIRKTKRNEIAYHG